MKVICRTRRGKDYAVQVSKDSVVVAENLTEEWADRISDALNDHSACQTMKQPCQIGWGYKGKDISHDQFDVVDDEYKVEPLVGKRVWENQ